MKVEAQYEVLGNDATKMSVPPGTIETLGSCLSRKQSSIGAFSECQPSTSYWATFSSPFLLRPPGYGGQAGTLLFEYLFRL
jgi:hypothetical protein